MGLPRLGARRCGSRPWSAPGRSRSPAATTGERRPVAVECRGGGSGLRAIVRAAAGGRRRHVGRGGRRDDAIRVLVGPWARLREDPAAAQIEDGPQASGVFADLSAARPAPDCRLRGARRNRRARRTPLGAGAGLVAATRRYDAPPTWVVTGCDDRGVAGPRPALDDGDLRDRYAVLVEGDGDVVHCRCRWRAR